MNEAEKPDATIVSNVVFEKLEEAILVEMARMMMRAKVHEAALEATGPLTLNVTVSTRFDYILNASVGGYIFYVTGKKDGCTEEIRARMIVARHTGQPSPEQLDEEGFARELEAAINKICGTL